MPVSENFDVFLSHSHVDADWVENLARRLEDEEGFKVWLDKWILIPGEPWQQAMARGLDQADSCAVCVGEQTPTGWFREEIQRALNRQTKDPSFRVMPVLLPNAKAINIDDFLELRTWVDFRHGSDPAYAFHLLTCGVKGVPPGRWPSQKPTAAKESSKRVVDKLRELRRLRQDRLIDDEIAKEYQRKLLSRHLIGER